VLPLIEAMADGEDDRIRECRIEIDRLEHDAEEIKHAI
jgi:uncharacterized protein Yka (UPF0111/DUF47 family)